MKREEPQPRKYEQKEQPPAAAPQETSQEIANKIEERLLMNIREQSNNTIQHPAEGVYKIITIDEENKESRLQSLL